MLNYAKGWGMKSNTNDEASGEPREEAVSSIDLIIDRYKRDVDRTLLRRNLGLTTTQRIEQLMEMHRFVDELRRAMRAAT